MTRVTVKVPGVVKIDMPNFSENVKRIFEDPSLPFADLFKTFQDTLKSLSDLGLSLNIKGLKEQLEPLIEELLIGLKSVLNDFAFIANDLISKSNVLVQDLFNTVFSNLTNLVKDIFEKVNGLLNQAESLGENLVQKIAELNDKIFNNLSEFRQSLFVSLNTLINNAETAANRILYKGHVIATGTIEQIKLELDNLALSIQNYFDNNPFSSEARKRKEISEKIKKYYSINLIPIRQWGRIQTYDYLCCYTLMVEDYEIKNKKGNERIGNIETIYGDLQDKAWRLSILGRDDSKLSTEAMEDWVKYGQLYELWHKLGNEDMMLLDAINSKLRELDEAKDKFKERSAQIEYLKGELQNISAQLQNKNTSAQISPLIVELQRELQYISSKLHKKEAFTQIDPSKGVLQRLNLVLATSLGLVNK